MSDNIEEFLRDVENEVNAHRVNLLTTQLRNQAVSLQDVKEAYTTLSTLSNGYVSDLSNLEQEGSNLRRELAKTKRKNAELEGKLAEMKRIIAYIPQHQGHRLTNSGIRNALEEINLLLLKK